ncbi:uncharacterized protein [Rutidosis leptorrhynchoides]|uniref:uncharacterized protein n=1 Tax=Rutidosis leptorrhynchoides TaxID=125765 RepID=UPI003A9978ED
MSVSNNDLNVLNQSTLFYELKSEIVPPTSFDVNGHHYTKGYYLADGIYSDLVTFIKGWSCPTDKKMAKITRFQAAARKDVQRAFEVLQSRFHILKIPSRTVKVNKMSNVMRCCLILYNMIQKDNRFTLTPSDEKSSFS